ncbi:MAG: FAD-dependent oxidoreductase [Syntrophaceae bacterium]|nr:FAD-dependent oxidoreductase [Syntrophaceae bacterium]
MVHDRPVFGGNASSEIRMWLCGARGENNRETGIIEEIQLENLHRNPRQNYSIWDSILYEKVRFEPNIQLFLNCSCNNAVTSNSKIENIKCWQLTSETWHIIKAKYFADCSGDSILAPLCGADFRYGREAAEEFDEDIAPADSDNNTMGMSCLIQARQTNSPQKFIPPSWAYVYESDDCLPNRHHGFANEDNFWWMELGGTRDTIHDTEEIRDDLLKVAFGVWDHIKNRGAHGAENWELDWVGFLPGKRESRRLIGDHVLTQNDVRSGGQFKDIIAYGGWPMDDHHPKGLDYPGKPTIFHSAPSPFGIPYRCVYSKNIENLFFAGRNISATHVAMSSTRVMATCATLGQAVGTAAAIANQFSLTPRQVGSGKIELLQQTLMQDDCYLPGLKREISNIARHAKLTASSGLPENLRNGIDRPSGEESNSWQGGVGDWVEYELGNDQKIRNIRLVFDSNLNRQIKNSRCSWPLNYTDAKIPPTLVVDFDIEVKRQDGSWNNIAQIKDNYKRLVNIKCNHETSAIKLTIRRTHNNKTAEIFAFDME